MLKLMMMIYILLMVVFMNMKSISMMMTIIVLYTWIILMIISLTNKNLYFINFMLLVMIISFFFTEYLWKFYIIYEMTILPMSVLILGWGMNPYRFPASFYMLMYTMFFSLPMMIMILWNYKKMFFNLLFIKNMYLSFFMMNMLMIMFLVKVPIFFLHYWLLKAHVEASTSGSIILASGLLKMGSFGVLKLMMWFNFYSLYYNLVLYSASLSSVMCVLQTDFKKMVALMSVSHMSLSVGTLMLQMNSSFKSFLFLNVSHTLASGFMFYLSGIFFSFSKTRLLFNLSFMLFNTMYYVFISSLMINMGIPPFFSFMSEIFNLSTMFYFNLINIIMISIYVLFTSFYSLMILNSLKLTKYKIIKNKMILMCYFFLSFIISLWIFIIY